ncbi:MAG: hypothetical protein GSR84_09065 [Desulfurococcales archaeon]|nr:hypothetical protein [Desulfurococcales archaeon]
MKLVIVYHDPGDPLGHGMVEALANEASRRLGVPVETVTISKLERGEYRIPRGSMVYALFLARGGHVEVVAEAARASGALYIGSIPPRITGETLATVLGGCRSIALVYWPAKRFVERQRTDLEEIRARLESALEVPVVLRRDCSECNEDCVVPLVLMPGRLSRKIRGEVGARARISHLLPLIQEKVLAHIEESIVKARAAPYQGVEASQG